MQCPRCDKEIPTDRVFCNWCEAFVPHPESGVKAGLFRRWLASFIDPILLILGILLPMGFMGAIGGEAAGGPLAIGAVLVTIGLFVLMYSRGLTPGKWVLGARVVEKIGGRSPGFIKMFVREIIGKFVSGLFLGLGFFWAIWDKDHQAWHDKIAGTVVVLDRPMFGRQPATA